MTDPVRITLDAHRVASMMERMNERRARRGGILTAIRMQADLISSVDALSDHVSAMLGRPANRSDILRIAIVRGLREMDADRSAPAFAGHDRPRRIERSHQETIRLDAGVRDLAESIAYALETQKASVLREALARGLAAMRKGGWT